MRAGASPRWGVAVAGAFVLGVLLSGVPVSRAQEPAAPEVPERVYDAFFEARIVPTERVARASIRIGDGASLVRWIELSIDPDRSFDWRGDGKIEVEGGRVRWTPPAGGGRLRYAFRIDHLRTASAYDARCAENWALFRGDDLFPPARVRSLVGARSRSRLRLRVPEGWSTVAPYEKSGAWFRIDHPRRRFDRPTGWMVVGQLGVLREKIAGVRVAVAGPVGQDLRRHDLLALLRWTLPSLRDALGELPDRFLVVGAGDPMWRGGLSGPRSVFVHADRPLISRDLTSPLLHELVHAVMRVRSGPGGDWIAEGLAEYYSLGMLVRSKTMSRKRYEKALTRMRQKGRRARRLDVEHASGEVTARAVAVLHDLDAEIRSATAGAASLDGVVRLLAEWREPVTPAVLRRAVGEVVGRDLAAFFRARVPGSG